MSEQLCPMCSGRKDEPRLIGFRKDDMGREFYVTVHRRPLTKKCWHPFHQEEIHDRVRDLEGQLEDLKYQVRVLEGKRDLLRRRLADCKMWRWHMATRLDEVEGVLRLLVDLKDGPRDAAYRRAKDEAWTRARYLLGKPDHE